MKNSFQFSLVHQNILFSFVEESVFRCGIMNNPPGRSIQLKSLNNLSTHINSLGERECRTASTSEETSIYTF